MRERTPSADDTPKRAPPAPPGGESPVSLSLSIYLSFFLSFCVAHARTTHAHFLYIIYIYIAAMFNSLCSYYIYPPPSSLRCAIYIRVYIPALSLLPLFSGRSNEPPVELERERALTPLAAPGAELVSLCAVLMPLMPT